MHSTKFTEKKKSQKLALAPRGVGGAAGRLAKASYALIYWIIPTLLKVSIMYQETIEMKQKWSPKRTFLPTDE